MIEVTESALSNVKDFLRQQKIDSPVRVTMVSSCGGSRLSLAVDDIKSTDLTSDQDGVVFIVDKGLFEICGAIKVDFVEVSAGGCSCSSSGGFKIDSVNSLPGDSCGCSCSSGSCG